MSKKKENLDEGMIMISSLLPVGPKPTLSMRDPRAVDNFEFKGWPMQFNENGEKIKDEHGNKIVVAEVITDDLTKIFTENFEGADDKSIENACEAVVKYMRKYNG